MVQCQGTQRSKVGFQVQKAAHRHAVSTLTRGLSPLVDCESRSEKHFMRLEVTQ